MARAMKALLVLLALASLAPLAPPAAACCHVLYLHQDAGPCYVEWKGDALRGETEYAEVGCLGEAVRLAP